MIKIKKLKNISESLIQLRLTDGFISLVPPGGTIEDIQITNLDEIKDSVSVTMDLGEVNESQNKTKLLD